MADWGRLSSTFYEVMSERDARGRQAGVFYEVYFYAAPDINGNVPPYWQGVVANKKHLQGLQGDFKQGGQKRS